MSKEGGEAKRFVLEGTDYVYPAPATRSSAPFSKPKA